MSTPADLIRAAVLRSFVEDERSLTVREIAAETGLSEYTVRKRIEIDLDLQRDLLPTRVERAQESRDYPGFVLRHRQVWAHRPSDRFLRNEIKRLTAAQR